MIRSSRSVPTIQMRLLILRGIILALVGTSLLAIPVTANNSHNHPVEVSEDYPIFSDSVYMGYGDGTNYDGYAHPFVDHPINSWKVADFLVEVKYFNAFYGWSCQPDHEHWTSYSAVHVHYSDSHGGIGNYEDLWMAQVGSSNPPIPYHLHRHHQYVRCGGQQLPDLPVGPRYIYFPV